MVGSPQGTSSGDDKDFWVVITIGGATLGTGLYALVAREWGFGLFLTVGGFAVLALATPSVRRLTGGSFRSRRALWALGVVTWLFLAVNVTLTIYPLHPPTSTHNSDQSDTTIGNLQAQLSAAQQQLQKDGRRMGPLSLINLWHALTQPGELKHMPKSLAVISPTSGNEQLAHDLLNLLGYSIFR